ncbi:MAG: hypothetical protein AAB011_07955 [Candidatus Eisenbacteria bacterium]
MIRKLFLSAITALIASTAAANDECPPLNASPETRAVICRMLAAHGDMARWRAAPSVEFHHVMRIPDSPEVWNSWETTEQGRRRTYQEWPLDKARIAYDGARTWSANWQKGNPPSFMVNTVYYFLNLPWIVFDPGVRLGAPGAGTLPGDPVSYTTVKMTVDPGVGATSNDYYTIYIDPKTGLMKATEYIVTHAALLDVFGLPPDRTFLGPFIHVYDSYMKVDGLAIPSSYRTFNPEGKVYGLHEVKEFSLSKAFDEKRLEMPADGKVDTSDPKRRKVQSSGGPSSSKGGKE